MTTFQDLQAEHEALLKRHEASEDTEQFWTDVQHFIDHVRSAAPDISAPRERDQLRAILRFWASYVYDKTRTYPDTNLPPARNAPSFKGANVESSILSTKPPTPTPDKPPHRSPLVWAIAALAVVAVVAIIFGATALGTSIQSAGVVPPATRFVPVNTPDASVNVPATSESSTAFTLRLQWNVLTAGPSPFDPNVWATRLQLGATGGNGTYIFWVNGARLPDVSDNQFTVEGTGCESKKPVVGVTSSGQATSLELIIQSPLPNCPQP